MPQRQRWPLQTQVAAVQMQTRIRNMMSDICYSCPTSNWPTLTGILTSTLSFREPAVQDRHLADSWVVPWGPGLRSDLVVEWEGFKAARAALAGTTSPAAAREQVGSLKRVVIIRCLC